LDNASQIIRYAYENGEIFLTRQASMTRNLPLEMRFIDNPQAAFIKRCSRKTEINVWQGRLREGAQEFPKI
jgi:hypothetical protein